jgi:hypothetical protein
MRVAGREFRDEVRSGQYPRPLTPPLARPGEGYISPDEPADA